MRSLVFLLVIYVLFCNNTNAEAVSKAKEAKIAYAKYLQSVCPLDENIFWLIDINKDKTLELITAWNGKLKKVGEIGYHWYDDNSTVRKPFLNGKWISKKKYNSTLKTFKKLTYHGNISK